MRAAESPYVREPGYPARYRDERFRTGSGPRTHAREVRAIRRLLRGVADAAGPWLDVPCGAGRLGGLLPGRVVGADRDPGMLRARPGDGAAVCASARALPFADGVFGGVLCMRLLHHVPAAEERVAILRELARVARGPIVVSFFHAVSLQHARRVAARLLGRARSGRGAITAARFRAELRAAGLAAVACRPLRRFVSEQWVVLARRA